MDCSAGSAAGRPEPKVRCSVHPSLPSTWTPSQVVPSQPDFQASREGQRHLDCSLVLFSELPKGRAGSFGASIGHPCGGSWASQRGPYAGWGAPPAVNTVDFQMLPEATAAPQPQPPPPRGVTPLVGWQLVGADSAAQAEPFGSAGVAALFFLFTGFRVYNAMYQTCKPSHSGAPPSAVFLMPLACSQVETPADIAFVTSTSVACGLWLACPRGPAPVLTGRGPRARIVLMGRQGGPSSSLPLAEPPLVLWSHC